uniref:Fragile X mental retardation 1 neighbor protein n=1 Tax=Prolemur simus TaxID=1328070 RepID=A0A8C8YK49_PROSS
MIPPRRKCTGSTRSKSREIRGASPSLVGCEVDCSVENPATGLDPGDSNAGQEAIMAATPQPDWQASVHGFRADTRRSLLNMSAHKRLRLLMFCIWILLVVCYYVSSGFPNSLSTNDYILWNEENADGQLLGEDSAWGIMLRFFFPTTCILKENQVAKPCNQLQDLNESECLRYKCCFSSLRTSGFSCYVPLRDKPMQMFRMFGIGAFSMIILGGLPLCCFSLCRRRCSHFKRKRKKPNTVICLNERSYICYTWIYSIANVDHDLGLCWRNSLAL